MTEALKGITVISLEQAVAAPLASLRLADAGARVIKVERPGGDFARNYDDLILGQSAYFVWLNRGKESICLDLKSPDERSVLERMLAEADVYIQNLKPGAISALGLGSEQLRARYPRLVTCDISGFGRTGPRAQLKAYDLIVQAEAGLCAITGTGEPARAGISVCDIAAGLNAYSAILEALISRSASGVGRAIEISLFDSIAEWMNVPLLQFIYGGRIAEPSGVAHPTIAPYGAFRCADGAEVILSVQNEREWIVLCERVLERPRLAADARFATNVRRVENRAALDGLISGRVRQLSESELVKKLEAASIAYGRLNSLPDAARHPHLKFLSVSTPGGEVRLIAPAGHSGRRARVPGCDEQGPSLRREFGSP